MTTVLPDGRLPLRRRIKKGGVRFVAALLPRLYLAYMRLVAATSRIERSDVDRAFDRVRSGRHVVLALLHQDVFVAPFLFRDRAIVTLVNSGDAGEIISAILERCGFAVTRGGTSSRASRRSPSVLRGIIREARQAPHGMGSLVGLTPDGSRGPPGAIRAGVALSAIHLDAETYCLKTHATRAWYLPTWDRTMIPLPFNRIRVYVHGPILPPLRSGHAGVEELRSAIERGLHELHRAAFAERGQRAVPELRRLESQTPERRSLT
jgi:lysophospholipid acyltransferase (LPLAT)-like uncharacterized protein